MTQSTTTLTWNDLPHAFMDTVRKLNAIKQESRIISENLTGEINRLITNVRFAVNDAANIGLVKVSETMDDALDTARLLAYGK